MVASPLWIRPQVCEGVSRILLIYCSYCYVVTATFVWNEDHVVVVPLLSLWSPLCLRSQPCPGVCLEVIVRYISS